MSIEMNTQIDGVGNGQTSGTQGADIEPINPAEVARQSTSSAPSQAPASGDGAAKGVAASGPTEADIINTPGTIAHQHMQNYLKTGDLASYNFAHFAAKMQLQQS